MASIAEIRAAECSPRMFDIVVERLKNEIELNISMAIRHPRFEDKFLSQAERAETQLNRLTGNS
jgi:hypothetical protein